MVDIDLLELMGLSKWLINVRDRKGSVDSSNDF